MQQPAANVAAHNRSGSTAKIDDSPKGSFFVAFYKKSDAQSDADKPSARWISVKKLVDIRSDAARYPQNNENNEFFLECGRSALWLHEWCMFNWPHLESQIMKYRLNKAGCLEMHVGHEEKSIRYAKTLIKSMGYDTAQMEDVRFFFKNHMLRYMDGSPRLTDPRHVLPEKFVGRTKLSLSSFEWSRLMTSAIHKVCKTTCTRCCTDVPTDPGATQASEVESLCRSVFFESKRDVWVDFLNSAGDSESNVRVKTYEKEKINATRVPCCECCQYRYAKDSDACQHYHSFGFVDSLFDSFFCVTSDEDHHCHRQHRRRDDDVGEGSSSSSLSSSLDQERCRTLWHEKNYEKLTRVAQNMIRAESCDEMLSPKDRFMNRKQHHIVCGVPFNVLNIMIDCWQWHLFVTEENNDYTVLNGASLGEDARFCNVLNQCYPNVDPTCLRAFHEQFGHAHCYNASELGLLYAISTNEDVFYRMMRDCINKVYVTNDGRVAFDDVSGVNGTVPVLPAAWYETFCKTEHERIYLNMACVVMVKNFFKETIGFDSVDVIESRLSALKTFVTERKTFADLSVGDSSDKIGGLLANNIAEACARKKETLLWLVGLPHSSWYEYSKHGVDNIERMLTWLSQCRARMLPPHLVHASMLSMKAVYFEKTLQTETVTQ